MSRGMTGRRTWVLRIIGGVFLYLAADAFMGTPAGNRPIPGFTAAAELQNVEIGGEIRIRGRYWHNGYEDALIGGVSTNRIPRFFLPDRPIGPFGTGSRYRFTGSGPDRSLIEQKTRIDVSADFTNDVDAVIVLESFDIWGEDFRSDYRTGADFRAVTNNDVEITQSFIDVENLFGQPFTLRIGRQPLALDKRWLVSDYISGTLSQTFDAVRLMYHADAWEVDVWAAKLAETLSNEQDGDVDFYGAHATLKSTPALHATLYWYMVRDGRRLNDTNFVAPLEWVEDILNLDDYDPSYLHTVGMRLNGDWQGWDYDWELAYQFGEVDSVGFGFRPQSTLYGDDSARADAWGTDLEVGYTFENLPTTPRFFVGGAWLSGDDNRDVSFLERLNIYDRPQSSIGFNRLFSGYVYSWILDVGQDMSNFKQVRLGAEANFGDSLVAQLIVSHYWVDEPFDLPSMITLGRYRVPVAPALSFLTDEASDDIGTTVFLSLRYQYSDDISFTVGMEHLFAGDALQDGNFLHGNGLQFTGGEGDTDADYFFFDTGIKFGMGRRSVDLHQIEYRVSR